MSNDEEMTQSISRKRTALESRLSEGRVQVHLDSTIDGVVLPQYLMGQIQVILNLSYGFKPDVFVIDEHGVQIMLSFSGKKTLCILPWACFYVMQTLESNGTIAGESEIFIESLPATLVRQISRDHQDEDESAQDDIKREDPEGEHTPEKGIISFKHFKKQRSETQES
jgi:hypothetical protein